MVKSSLSGLREKAGLTQRQLGDTIGVSDQTVFNWEKGIHLPKLTPAQTIALCKALSCSIEELAEAFE